MKVSSQDFCSRKTGLRSEIHKCGQRKMDNIWASEQQQTAGTSSSSESVWSSPMRGTATSRSHCTRQHASGRTPVSDSVWAKMCRRWALRAKLRALGHWEMENCIENLVWIKMNRGPWNRWGLSEVQVMTEWKLQFLTCQKLINGGIETTGGNSAERTARLRQKQPVCLLRLESTCLLGEENMKLHSGANLNSSP